jgi:hypothetical protein
MRMKVQVSVTTKKIIPGDKYLGTGVTNNFHSNVTRWSVFKKITLTGTLFCIL